MKTADYQCPNTTCVHYDETLTIDLQTQGWATLEPLVRCECGFVMVSAE